MNKVVRWGKYAGAFLLFSMSYAIIGMVARMIVSIVNADARGWVAEYAVPYFVATIAGGLGAAGGLATVESWIPSLRLRPIAWTFVGIVVVFFASTALGMAMGNTAESGLAEKAVQSLVAIITAWRISGQHDVNAPVNSKMMRG